MTRAPLVTAKPDAPFQRGDRTVYDTTLGWRFVEPRLRRRCSRLEAMGETGENVAERWGVSREDQDAFALRSQQRWAAADAAGRFADELVPVAGVERDEHPRPDTTAEKLASLKPAFRAGGTVTAGNASGINDGAAALVIASEERARGARRRAARRVRADRPRPASIRGVMGIGPIPAVREAARAHGRRDRRHRPRRAERGVRLADRSPWCASSASTRSASTSTAARSRSAIRSA